MEVTFFAVVNSFEYNNVISANFVQTVKNSNGFNSFQVAGVLISDFTITFRIEHHN